MTIYNNDDLMLGATASDDDALSAIPRLDSNTLVRTVRERIRQAIITEKFAPGERLNQAQIANKLNVSRMPVRTALSDLVSEELLEPISTGGFSVKALTKNDVLNAYEVRRALEAQAVIDIAEKQPNNTISILDDVLYRHRQLGGVIEIETLLELDREFHMALLNGTGNPFFGRVSAPLWSIVERVMFRMLRSIPDMFEVAWTQHTAIVDSIRAGDSGEAVCRLNEHLIDASTRLTQVDG